MAEQGKGDIEGSLSKYSDASLCYLVI